MRRTLFVAATALVLLVSQVATVTAHEQVSSRILNSSYYTNGPVKSVVAGFTHNACGLSSELELVVYYDIMNTSKIRITKLKVNYYLKGSSGSGVWGGWARVSKGSTTYQLGTQWGDYSHKYLFNPATKDADGYSYLGSYTHYGPLTVTGRTIHVHKLTNVDSASTCVGPWDYSDFQLSW